MKLPENRTLQFKNTTLEIQCLSGALWITWPNCNEMVLKAGQSATINCSGKICVLGLSPAEFRFEQTSKGFLNGLLQKCLPLKAFHGPQGQPKLVCN